MKLRIPWKNLKSQPAVISIERVFLLAGPKNKSDYNDEEYEKRLLETKRKRLKLAELLSNKQTTETTQPETKEGSYLSSYTSLIVNNLQIYIDKVHLRYEDNQSNPKVSISYYCFLISN